ncbi:hypothetical protein KKK_00680 [Pseudomonas putida B6-2]|nr:hypothetical protein KKK_00680 [Pseudomonas putida B6-2]
MSLGLAGTLPVAQFQLLPRQEFEAWILDRLWTVQRQHQQAELRKPVGHVVRGRLDHARPARPVQNGASLHRSLTTLDGNS